MMNNMLAGIMIVIAVLLLVASGRIDAALKNVQVQSDINNANKGIYTIGIIMLVAGVFLFVAGQKDLKIDSMILVGIVGLLGLVLLVLSAIVISKGQGEAKSWGVAVLVGGIVFLVGAGAVIANENKEKLKKLMSNQFHDDDEEFNMYDDDDTDTDDDVDTDGDSDVSDEFQFACY